MVLRVDGVSRRFGTIDACNRVSLSVNRGEVVALLGENGAGKSTLLSMIAGFVEPDAGTIEIDGKRLSPGSPLEAIQVGVGTAFQHFSLAPELRVRESLELARIDPAAAATNLPSSLSLNARIGELSVPERQQVEFLKARMLARHVLLLDEPTSLLGGTDVDRVLEQIRAVAATGVAVVFVTHRLREALDVADRIVVMRRGFVVERVTKPDGGWSEGASADLLNAMFGEVAASEDGAAASALFVRGALDTGDRIEVRGDLAGMPQNISLQAGQWLAVAGIAGNGQRDLVSLLTGQTTAAVTTRGADGTVRRIEGDDVHSWIAAKVSIVPEDRTHEGGSAAMTVAENLVLRDVIAGRQDRFGVLNRRRIRERAQELVRRWDIRPANPSARFGTLSGGNAQRVLLARALDPPPNVVVAVRPTHGLDHHSVAAVREALRAAADAGSAVVTIEQELDDAIRHADEIAVMFRGRLSTPEPVGITDRVTLQGMMVSGWEA